MPIKIAVSGDHGSFSEEAGLLYAQRMGWENPELVFVIDMEGVLKSINSGESDYGIFPVVNSRGGLVQMAFEAMGKYNFTLLDELPFEVHQCMMVLPNVKKEEITQIVSHPQGLAQCTKYLESKFPDVKLVEWQDTAKAARDLSEGNLSATSAVIAPARSSELYGLELFEKGIQDMQPNITRFIIVKKA